MSKTDFNTYFSNIYGERWDPLSSALKTQHNQVIRPLNFDSSLDSSSDPFNLPVYEKEMFEKVNSLSDEGLKQFFVMDPASIIAASALGVQENDFVLDMCSAPGGKSLVLLEKLNSGELWANEISQARRAKLKEVIRSHVPKTFRDRIFIKGKDGNRFGLMHPNTFDKILVDAPCSGEKHLLSTSKELEKWSPKRTKRLSTAQYSLLCSALLAAKSQGEIVYSTCSISPMENDDVIKKLLKKKGDQFELKEVKNFPSQVERTEFGYQILPDRSGHGPIYFTKIQKK